jgi:hypothetical protein
MFKSINSSRNLKIEVTVFVLVVNIDTESHSYVVCISCMYGSMQRKETVVNFPDCLYIGFYGVFV